jgi:hypothetical protein
LIAVEDDGVGVMRFGILLLAVVALFTGCSDPAKEGRVDVYPVTGTIKYAGAPVADALVSFAPLAEGLPVATGRTNAQGEFTLTTYESGDGAAPGDYNVVVTKVAAATPTPEPQHSADGSVDLSAFEHGAGGSGEEGGGSLIPEPSTPLTATVEAGPDNHFDLVIE